jgi:hypothetical protein
VNWVLDADIRDFFTSLDHCWLEKFLEHRIADKRILPPAPQVAEGGSHRKRDMVADSGRGSPGSIGVAPAGERLPPLCPRPVGPVVEESVPARRCDHRAFRRRLHCGL